MQMFGLIKVYSKIKSERDLTMLTAIETTGTVDANHQIVLDEDLPSNASSPENNVPVVSDDELTLCAEEIFLEFDRREAVS